MQQNDSSWWLKTTQDLVCSSIATEPYNGSSNSLTLQQQPLESTQSTNEEDTDGCASPIASELYYTKGGLEPDTKVAALCIYADSTSEITLSRGINEIQGRLPHSRSAATMDQPLGSKQLPRRTVRVPVDQELHVVIMIDEEESSHILYDYGSPQQVFLGHRRRIRARHGVGYALEDGRMVWFGDTGFWYHVYERSVGSRSPTPPWRTTPKTARPRATKLRREPATTADIVLTSSISQSRLKRLVAEPSFTSTPEEEEEEEDGLTIDSLAELSPMLEKSPRLTPSECSETEEEEAGNKQQETKPQEEGGVTKLTGEFESSVSVMSASKSTKLLSSSPKHQQPLPTQPLSPGQQPSTTETEMTTPLYYLPPPSGFTYAPSRVVVSDDSSNPRYPYDLTGIDQSISNATQATLPTQINDNNLQVLGTTAESSDFSQVFLSPPSKQPKPIGKEPAAEVPKKCRSAEDVPAAGRSRRKLTRTHRRNRRSIDLFTGPTDDNASSSKPADRKPNYRPITSNSHRFSLTNRQRLRHHRRTPPLTLQSSSQLTLKVPPPPLFFRQSTPLSSRHRSAIRSAGSHTPPSKTLVTTADDGFPDQALFPITQLITPIQQQKRRYTQGTSSYGRTRSPSTMSPAASTPRTAPHSALPYARTHPMDTPTRAPSLRPLSEEKQIQSPSTSPELPQPARLLEREPARKPDHTTYALFDPAGDPPSSPPPTTTSGTFESSDSIVLKPQQSPDETQMDEANGWINMDKAPTQRRRILQRKGRKSTSSLRDTLRKLPGNKGMGRTGLSSKRASRRSASLSPAPNKVQRMTTRASTAHAVEADTLVAITGFQGTDKDRILSQIANTPGMVVTEDPLVADVCVREGRLGRTLKVLCALAQGIPVVTSHWIHTLSPDAAYDHLLDDPQTEGEWRMTLKSTIECRQKMDKGVFDGFCVYVCGSIRRPDPFSLATMVRAAGGYILNDFRPKQSMSAKTVGEPMASEAVLDELLGAESDTPTDDNDEDWDANPTSNKCRRQSRTVKQKTETPPKLTSQSSAVFHPPMLRSDSNHSVSPKRRLVDESPDTLSMDMKEMFALDPQCSQRDMRVMLDARMDELRIPRTSRLLAVSGNQKADRLWMDVHGIKVVDPEQIIQSIIHCSLQIPGVTI